MGTPNSFGANSVSVLLNNGPGALPLFSLEDDNNLIKMGNAMEPNAFDLTSGDFDGDEKPDVAISNTVSIAELSVVAVLINDTAGLGEQPSPAVALVRGSWSATRARSSACPRPRYTGI
jgi:hypothetical protein